MTDILTRDAILGADDIDIERIDVPEWGGGVFVKGMTGSERDAFESSIVEERGKNRTTNLANIRAKLAAQTICDAEGKRLFSDKDVVKLGKKSAAALERVFTVARRLSGILGADIEELAEEVSENPSGGSASD